MCGIVGYVSFTSLVSTNASFALEKAVQELSKRGPNASGFYHSEKALLGHTRLSIIDTSTAANQPFKDPSGRYVLVFNGEIFNYKELRQNLQNAGIRFQTSSDTEVLLHLIINEGPSALTKLNGFFAFALWDNAEHRLLLARDRMGVKPLFFSQTNEGFAFGSEVKAVLPFFPSKTLNTNALFYYLQLNYIPGFQTMFEGIEQLENGSYLILKNNKIEKRTYFDLLSNRPKIEKTYSHTQEELVSVLREAVRLRLVADVPVGTFLSGGIDSSVITTLAAQEKKDIWSFSVGYKDNPFFDETAYALLVAKKCGTNHHVFSLSNQDLFDHFQEMADYWDQPFADSSALPVYILSKYTKNHVTVALSGDGADEIFSGYAKHAAEWNVLNNPSLRMLSTVAGPFAKLIPNSRSSPLSNLARKLNKFSEGNKLSPEERYWLWCSISNEIEVRNILNPQVMNHVDYKYKQEFLKAFQSYQGMEAVLYSDAQMVLRDDMLVKADRMSMANGLEVRNPFLDYRVVDFAFGLPIDFKINKNLRKRIVQDAFRSILPPELYNRPKKGFEIPLLDWMRNNLYTEIEQFTDKDFLIAQNIFQPASVEKLVTKLHSRNPGDSPAKLWAILLFQKWWKKYME